MYNPQVEAISPTLPLMMDQEDQAFKTTKDELLQQIAKVDREIAKAEAQIGILKKRQTELEELALKPAPKTEAPEDTQPKHQSLAQKIYAENRKKAQSAHASLEAFGPKVSSSRIFLLSKTRKHFAELLVIHLYNILQTFG